MFHILSRALPSLKAPIASLNYGLFDSFAGLRNSWIPTLRTPTSMLMGDIRAKCCLRTNKSAAKRFRVMGNGRIKRKKAGKRHNTGHKGRSRVNRLAQGAPIKEKKIEERMRRLIAG